MALNAAMANSHGLMAARYAKSCNHVCMAHHVSGMAMMQATDTSARNSLDTKTRMLCTDAPKILRTPISLVLCCVICVASPNKPRQAISMATMAKAVKICPVFCSEAYREANLSSRKNKQKAHPDYKLPIVSLCLPAD